MDIHAALTKEVVRCKKIAEAYAEIGQPGILTKIILDRDIELAEHALVSLDAVAIIRQLETLKEYKL